MSRVVKAFLVVGTILIVVGFVLALFLADMIIADPSDVKSHHNETESDYVGYEPGAVIALKGTITDIMEGDYLGDNCYITTLDNTLEVYSVENIGDLNETVILNVELRATGWPAVSEFWVVRSESNPFPYSIPGITLGIIGIVITISSVVRARKRVGTLSNDDESPD